MTLRTITTGCHRITRGSKDPFILQPNDFVEERFARLVREALEKNLISMGRAGEMMNRCLEDMRRLAKAWQEP